MSLYTWNFLVMEEYGTSLDLCLFWIISLAADTETDRQILQQQLYISLTWQENFLPQLAHFREKPWRRDVVQSQW